MSNWSLEDMRWPFHALVFAKVVDPEQLNKMMWNFEDLAQNTYQQQFVAIGRKLFETVCAGKIKRADFDIEAVSKGLVTGETSSNLTGDWQIPWWPIKGQRTVLFRIVGCFRKEACRRCAELAEKFDSSKSMGQTAEILKIAKRYRVLIPDFGDELTGNPDIPDSDTVYRAYKRSAETFIDEAAEIEEEVSQEGRLEVELNDQASLFDEDDDYRKRPGRKNRIDKNRKKYRNNKGNGI